MCDEKNNWLESIWESSATGWVLVLSGMGGALWVAYHPQPVGYSIGMLALTAGVMSVKPMKTPEKLCWVGLLIAFTILEVNAITKSNQDAHEARDEQNKAFQAIVDDLKGSMAASEEQYKNTIGRVDGVAKTAQEVSSLSKESLENVTGGDSYGYVIPDTQITRNVRSSPFSGFSLTVINGGKSILSGVTVSVSVVTKEGPNGYLESTGGVDAPTQVGSLAPSLIGAQKVPNIRLHPGDYGSYRYLIYVTAQNGTTKEDLWFRRAINGIGWAYKYDLVSGSLKNGEKARPSKDWTEPTLRDD